MHNSTYYKIEKSYKCQIYFTLEIQLKHELEIQINYFKQTLML